MSLQRPNVLAIVTYKVFPPVMGGQKGVAVFYKYLQKHLPVFLALSNDNKEIDKESSVNILFPNKLIYLDILRINRLKKIIKKQGINFIIIEHSYPGFIGLALKRLTGVPFAVHLHNIEAERFRQMNRWWWKHYSCYEKWVLQKADLLFFISEEDREKALKTYHVNEEKCSVVTYGIEPINEEVIEPKNESRKILYFNGTLDYLPNKKAVAVLINEIEPRLKEKKINFVIHISGANLPKEIEEQLVLHENIKYLGVVENVSEQYKKADLFLNPVVNDSGVKTKVIEAIACHCPVVSTLSGASGLNKSVCGEKLIVVTDNDWEELVNAIILQLKQPKAPTPDKFFTFYSWDNITIKAAQSITSFLS